MTKISALIPVAQTIPPHPSLLNCNERRIKSRTMAEIWCTNTAATYTINESQPKLRTRQTDQTNDLITYKTRNQVKDNSNRTPLSKEPVGPITPIACRQHIYCATDEKEEINVKFKIVRTAPGSRYLIRAFPLAAAKTGLWNAHPQWDAWRIIS